MTKLKLGPIQDEKPVELTIELPAAIHRDLTRYAEALALETGETIGDPARLVAPMLARFIASDRAFARIRNLKKRPGERSHAASLPTSNAPD